MPAIKFKMVLLYWRLFSTNDRIRYALWAVSGLLIAWTIATVFTGLFQCNPTGMSESPATASTATSIS